MILTDGNNQFHDHDTEHREQLGAGLRLHRLRPDRDADRLQQRHRRDSGAPRAARSSTPAWPATCTAMKAEGIRIYTIIFGGVAGHDGAGRSSRNCATTPAMYYYAPNNAALAERLPRHRRPARQPAHRGVDGRCAATAIRRPRLAAATRGATAVEFALILPLLLLFIVGGDRDGDHPLHRLEHRGGGDGGVALRHHRHRGGRQPRGQGAGDRRPTAPTACSTWTRSRWRRWSTRASPTSASRSPSPTRTATASTTPASPSSTSTATASGTRTWARPGSAAPSDVVVYRLTYDWGVVTPVMREVIGDSVTHVSSIAVRNEPF